mmetsp:Transcript_11453/g.20653  ORF Transcript_11453/g.20653 Transcript_11453/m.20653 type:complete len:216 (-) Transcript_11453:3408-4055(-)
MEPLPSPPTTGQCLSRSCAAGTLCPLRRTPTAMRPSPAQPTCVAGRHPRPAWPTICSPPGWCGLTWALRGRPLCPRSLPMGAPTPTASSAGRTATRLSGGATLQRHSGPCRATPAPMSPPSSWGCSWATGCHPNCGPRRGGCGREQTQFGRHMGRTCTSGCPGSPRPSTSSGPSCWTCAVRSSSTVSSSPRPPAGLKGVRTPRSPATTASQALAS